MSAQPMTRDDASPCTIPDAESLIRSPTNCLPTARPGDACLRWDMRLALEPHDLEEFDERLRHDPVRPLAVARPPDPGQWAGALARGIVEILVGVRPLTQLRRWVVPALYEQLARNGAAMTPGLSSTGCRILSTHVAHVRPGVVEAGVIIGLDGRTRALALRLEEFRGRWLTTALDIA